MNPFMNESLEPTTLSTNEKKIIVCMPVVIGNGSKYTAMNLAHYYKVKNPEARVALIDLDFHYPTMFGNETSFDQVHNIDNLLDKIDGRQLNTKLFHENMIQLQNQVDFLKGTTLGANHVAIQRHHIEEIFSYLRDEYDRVFVSIANVDDNAGTVYGLKFADDVVLVAVNNYTNYTKIDQALELVRRYFHKHLHQKLIFNRYNDKSTTEFGHWLNENKVQALGSILYDPRTTDGADLTGSFLSRLTSKKANKLPINYETILNQLV